MKMEQIVCSETSAYKIQTPGNHPEENIQHVVDYLHPSNTDSKHAWSDISTPSHASIV
jgi:hypothetical protein